MAADKAEIVQAVPAPGQRAEEIPAGPDPDAPAVGRWYWVKNEDPVSDVHPYLACVVHVGSNYAEMRGAGDREWHERIHFDHFWARCTPERTPERIIGGEVASRQTKVIGLMRQVHEITARLAITPGLALTQGSETQALALRKNDQPVDEYKAALEYYMRRLEAMVSNVENMGVDLKEVCRTHKHHYASDDQDEGCTHCGVRREKCRRS